MMSNKKRLPTLVILALMAVLTAGAQQFQATHLKKAAAKLKLDSAALATDSLPATKIVTVGARKVAIRKNARGVVEHIGIPLFAEEMRQLKPSPIYDYLEFTVLDRLFQINDNTLTLQDLKFEKGNLAILAKVMDTADGCSIDNVSEKYYRVKWTAGTTQLVVVSFPIDYELLSNSNRKELEANFIRDIRNYSDTTSITPKNYSEQMAPTDNPDIFVVPGSSYVIREINNNRYLSISTQSTGEGDVHKLGLVFDRHLPQESLANIMVEYDMPIDQAEITLEFVLGNFKRDTVTVAVRDWIGFCMKQGCRPYFGFEENDNGKLTGTLIMSNRLSGYDHVVAVTATESELFSDHPRLHAKVHLFTPSSNVKNLFGVVTTPNRPRIQYTK